MKNRLYVVTSLLHALMAVAHSLSMRDGKSRFVFLEWWPENLERLLPCLKQYAQIGDEHILLISNKEKKKASTKKVLKFAQQQTIVELYTGNDRHIEFQYLAYHLKKEQSLLTFYLDEGLYTYQERQRSKRISERIFKQAARKLYFGWWWQTPKTIGASKYIDRCLVLFPQHVNRCLKQKPCDTFDSNVFSNETMQSFANCWLSAYQQVNNLQAIDVLFTIPHQNNFKRIEGYRDYLFAAIGSLLKQGKEVAIKYHPNSRQNDLLSLKQVYPKVRVLPSSAPFELLALQLAPATLIVAEFSTILLTSKLVNPQLRVVSVWFNERVSQASAEHLAQFLSVETKHYQALLSEFEQEADNQLR